MSTLEPDDSGPPESIEEQVEEEHGVDVGGTERDDGPDLDGIGAAPPD